MTFHALLQIVLSGQDVIRPLHELAPEYQNNNIEIVQANYLALHNPER